jgi:hypothetical protein
MVLLHQLETQSSLGRSTVINAVFEHTLSGPELMGRRSNRDFKFQSCAAGVARSSTAQAGCVIAHTYTEPAKAIERRPCSRALYETS